MCVYVCACVCTCAERQKDRQTEKENELTNMEKVFTPNASGLADMVARIYDGGLHQICGQARKETGNCYIQVD